MSPAIASSLLPILRRFEPETAHNLALWALRSGLVGRDATADDPCLSVDVLGLHFSNPIGLAAGFDKDAVALAPLMQLGFGLIEAGTVTPRPQLGNPRPRLFRLDADQAVINRFGFNNNGLAAYLSRIEKRPASSVVLGCNVGINKEGAYPEKDYPELITALAPHADYLVINVSSPNTPGLRDLQSERQLRGILHAVAQQAPHRPPLLIKIAPDLDPVSLKDLVEVCVDAGVQGLIVSNTTTSRPPSLHSLHSREVGGLSGAPLFTLSTALLARAFLLAEGRLTLIGAGGIFTAADVLAKIRAGASLVQLYTGLVFAGPALIPRLKRELVAEMRKAGISSLTQIVGIDAATYARDI